MNAKETVALIGAHTIGRAFKVLPSSLGVVLLQTGKHACKSTHNFVAPCFVFCFFLNAAVNAHSRRSKYATAPGRGRAGNVQTAVLDEGKLHMELVTEAGL